MDLDLSESTPQEKKNSSYCKNLQDNMKSWESNKEMKKHMKPKCSLCTTPFEKLYKPLPVGRV